MDAPIGVFAGRDNRDAVSVSAPHCKESIATRERHGNPARNSFCGLRSKGPQGRPAAAWTRTRISPCATLGLYGKAARPQSSADSALCYTLWETFALVPLAGRIRIGRAMCIRRRGQKVFMKLHTWRNFLTLSRSTLLSTNH